MKTNRSTSVTFFIFLFICGTTFSYSQSNQSNEDWWKPITKKHNISYESYTTHGQFVIISGKKTISNGVESFFDVTAISGQKNNYTIYTSREASYNPETTVLRIYNCTMKVYDWNSKNLEPSNTFSHISYMVNFAKGFSNMADTIIR